MAFSLTWLPRVLTNAGLKVAEVPGWTNRGHGDVGTIKGVICHHTAGAKSGNMPSLGVVRDGRKGLTGPLAQLGLGRDGTFYIIAAGKCFHAGTGNWKGITAGNTHFIGIEAENTGGIHNPPRSATSTRPKDPPYDLPWPEVQMDAYRRGVAAILKHIGQDEAMCCGHKEYATPKGRKNDPTFDDKDDFKDMDNFRAEVAAILGGNAPKPVLIPVKNDEHKPTLRRSSTGNPSFLVKELQSKIGFSGSQVDGHFGPLTEAAVRKFQRNQDLVPDGIVGPKTWAVLDKL